MKYFTKWLPTNEKIEEHDIVLARGIRGTVVHCYEDGAFEVESEFFTDDDMRVKTFEAKEVKKAKLFLCTRDIQLGDKCFGYNGAPYKNYILEEVIIINLPQEGQYKVYQSIYPPDSKESCIISPFPVYEPYKVIGEVSPEAIWVKEGDEIEEDMLLAHGSGVNWDRTGNHQSKFQIKCPTCGHFH